MKKIVIIGFLLISAVLLAACSPAAAPATPEVENLAKCLTEKGIKMYGTEWCPHCKDQKALFASAFEFVDYIDCDKDRDTCVDAGIQGYPTWIIDGKQFSGTQQLYTLSRESGCSLTA